MKNDWGKYIITFFITVSLFAIAAGLSNFFSDKKIQNMRSIQNKIATDILSSETQFALLSELSCVQDEESNNFSLELNELADKINFAEQNMKNTEEVIELKRYYSLLQIKDFLLTKKINEKCDGKLVPILYFYTTADTCTECVKQSLVLTELRQKYSNIRVYSFDYNLNLSALNALIKIYKIEDTKLPAIIVNEKKATGFKTIEEIESLEPNLMTLKKVISPADEKETDTNN